MLHVVIGPVDQDLLDQFFLDEGDIAVRPQLDSVTMEGLLVAANVFTSKGQARKSSFSGPVPMGVHLLGTKKNRFWCWVHPSMTSDRSRCDHRCHCPWKVAAPV